MMLAFSVAAAALLLVSMACVLWPLWWGKQPATSRREANIAVYEQHAAEIDRELATQQMTAEAAGVLRSELDARLLRDVDDVPQARSYTKRNPWLASTVVVVGFAVFAIGLYSLIGDTRGLEPQTAPDIPALVAKMKARLAAVPGDQRTRVLLGQVQMAQDRYAAAAQTFAEVNSRDAKPNTAFLLAEARARVLNNSGRVNDRAQALYEQVLTLSPDNAEALWFAGQAALAEGDSSLAAKRWQHLLEQDIPDKFRARVERRLAEVEGRTPDLKPQS